MPRIWLDYCQFLVSQCKITRSRQTFDRALRALPVTQHPRIWPLYLRFVRSLSLPETAIRVYRRYLKVIAYSFTPKLRSSIYNYFISCFTAMYSGGGRRLTKYDDVNFQHISFCAVSVITSQIDHGCI